MKFVLEKPVTLHEQIAFVKGEIKNHAENCRLSRVDDLTFHENLKAVLATLQAVASAFRGRKRKAGA